MRILFLTNSDVSAPLVEWLKPRNELIVQSEPITADYVMSLRPDIAVSYSYRHLVRSATLDTLPGRFVNLHISYLPFNRGADPNFWSLVEGTPSGVSIHLMSPGVDEGDILAQEVVEIDQANHTLKSSYDVLQAQIQALFRKNWASIADGTVKPFLQPAGGSVHYARQLAAIRDAVLGPEGWHVPVTTLRQRYAALQDRGRSN